MNNMDEKEDTIDLDLVKSILSSGSFGSFGFSPAFGLLGAMLMSKKKTNEMKTDIEIPFGAKDSELKGWEYTIPEGMEAIVKDGKVIVKEKESEDERIRKEMLDYFKDKKERLHYLCFECGDVKNAPFSEAKQIDDFLAYLENLKEQKPFQFKNNELVDIIKGEFEGFRTLLKKKGIDYEPQRIYWEGFARLFDSSAREYVRAQEPVMIQWTGKNLKEVIDFTGKSPKFGEWFKSWAEFENYVHSHDDILKLFCEDGSHYEVPVGAWIVKTPDGYNIPSRFRFIQKPAEWSEEDKIRAKMLEHFKSKTKKTWCNIPVSDIISWLEHTCASSGGQPVKWSEEDKECINGIVRYLEASKNPEDTYGVGEIDYYVSWLNSLRPHWKPSEEDLDAIKELIDDANKRGWVTPGASRLYEQLKAL